MDRWESGFKASRRFVLCAMLLALLPTALAHGQTQPPMPEATSATAASGDPHEDEIAGLRQLIEQMQQRLKAQQAQLDQQAIKFQQLEAQPPAVPENQPAPASPAAAAVAPATAAPQPNSADPTPAGTIPPGILLPSWGAAEGSCYPRMIVGGQYRMMYSAADNSYHQASISDSPVPQAFVNERLRTWLTVQTSDNVEAYVQAQMGNVLWGTNYDLPKTFTAPFTAADQVGVMLRYGYLTYHSDDLGRLQAGIQPWQDCFSQTLFSSDWDFSVGGLSWVRNFPDLENGQMRFGIFELVEGDATLVDQSYLITLDLDRPVGDKNSVGFSAYYLPDRGGYSYPAPYFAAYQSAWDVWLGGRFRLGSTPVPINGFAVVNMGQRQDLGGVPVFNHEGIGTKLEAGAVPVGPGKVSCQALYSTGGSTPGGGFRTVAQSAEDNFGAEGYWSYLMLTSPQGYSDVNDLGVSLQNRGCGLMTVQAKYEYPLFGRLSGTLAAGWLRSDTANPANGSTDMGTELGHDFTLDFGGGLKADMGAVVLFTGDFYKASAAAATPADVYEAFARLQLEF
jgi:hypothetical protein